MFSLLAAGLSAAEKGSISGYTTLIGVLTTFVVLSILIVAIVALRYALAFIEAKYPGFAEKIKTKFKSLKKKKDLDNKDEETATVAVDNKVEEIDADTLKAIEESVKSFSKNTAEDGKPHDNIKIVSVKEVPNND